MTDVLLPGEELSSELRVEMSCERAQVSQRDRGGSAPPERPPTLRRNTTSEIETQLDEDLSSDYQSHLMEDDVFASISGLKEEHYYHHNPPDDCEGDSLHMKEVMKEISKTLPKQMEINARGSMFVKFDEENPRYLRAMLTGVEGTPYSSGIFMFDIFLPPDYPHTPCHCRHVTPNANLVHANNGPGGFSPNLHSDTGQVCLSLLGTWDGPGWQSGTSNVYQVLSTILYMILGAKHPYYMEPDYGGWEGTAPERLEDDPDADKVEEYDEEVKLFNAKLCILAPLINPPVGFESLARRHLFKKRKLILATLRRWASKGTEDFKENLSKVILDIEKAYSKNITQQYAQEDHDELEQVIRYIDSKMEYLTDKIKFCSSTSSVLKCSCTKHGSACTSCCSQAKQTMPKAYERYQLGPKLLIKARKDLAKAKAVVQTAPKES